MGLTNFTTEGSKSGRPLAGRVALVTGASRGIGRGVAMELAEAGATVYITGRVPPNGETSTGQQGGNSTSETVLPSLYQTAEEIRARGGNVRPIYCNHARIEETKRLFQRIEEETGGVLDILVNNAFTALQTIFEQNGRRFYECDVEIWDAVNNVGLRNHYVCAVYATRLMIQCRMNAGKDDVCRGTALIVNVSSYGGLFYMFNVAYGAGKAAIDRMSADMAVDLAATRAPVLMVTLWPGLVRTELFVDKAQHTDALEQAFQRPKTSMGRRMELAESPQFVGRAVVALAVNAAQILRRGRSGRIFTTADVAAEYHITDPQSGRRPADMRSMAAIPASYRYERIMRFVPWCIKVPKVLLHLAANKF